jgi:predicted alpha/beta-fold hydrolase
MSGLEIGMIPKQALALAIPHVGPALLKGLAVTDTRFSEAIDDMIAGRAQLWAIAHGGKCLAAFLTAFHVDDDGSEFIQVYGLGGDGLRKWACELDRAMLRYAVAEGVKTIRFCGSEAWSRVLPTYRVVGRRHDGIAEYERSA